MSAGEAPGNLFVTQDQHSDICIIHLDNLRIVPIFSIMGFRNLHLALTDAMFEPENGSLPNNMQ